MLRRVTRVGVLAGALLLSAPQARGGEVVDSCCGCVLGIGASENLTDAFFCGFFTAEQVPGAIQRCEALGQTSLICEPPVAGRTCAESLRADLAIQCPITAPVPTAGAGGLMLLAIGLATAGIAAVRRRRFAQA
jgi:hypothetical protein